MKMYFKFFIVIFAVSIACLGNVQKAHAIRTPVENVKCVGDGHCGWTKDCEEIKGTATAS